MAWDHKCITLSFSTATLYTELVTPFKKNIAEPVEVLMEVKWEHFSEKKKTFCPWV